jgi:2-dehydro-3-deoxygalactonokinase
VTVLATIDCGTTNSRVYIVESSGRVIAKAAHKVGVRDTAIHGDNSVLKEGLRQTVMEALSQAGLGMEDLAFAISSGMITSELGLLEVPHLWAPVGLEELAASLKEVRDPEVFPLELPIYFIRGVKNRYDPATAGIADVGTLDFMRGEEVQVAGLLASYHPRLPLTAVILSSHTKFVAVDARARILGSVTTLSGQVYEAVIKETSIGKSIRGPNGSEGGDYFDAEVLDAAYTWVSSSGFLRTLLMARFLDTLLSTRWYERRLFVEGAIAAEDLRAYGQLEALGFAQDGSFALVGAPGRCAIYRYLFREKLGIRSDIVTVSEEQALDMLSISGTLSVAQRAGLIR